MLAGDLLIDVDVTVFCEEGTSQHYCLIISQERWYIFVLFHHMQNNKMAYCLIL